MWTATGPDNFSSEYAHAAVSHIFGGFLIFVRRTSILNNHLSWLDTSGCIRHTENKMSRPEKKPHIIYFDFLT